jgi:hypothetical protein
VAANGGISIVQAVNPANFTSMSLIVGGAGNISQAGGGTVTIANLNADASGTGSVTLNASNVVSSKLAWTCGCRRFPVY